MFDLSIEKLLVLAVVALFVLGPERLPAAAAWLAHAVRQVKHFTGDAHDKLRSELGPELDQLRQPLNELRNDLAELRAAHHPRLAMTRLATPPDGPPPIPHQQSTSQPHQPLATGERPPVDLDAT